MIYTKPKVADIKEWTTLFECDFWHGQTYRAKVEQAVDPVCSFYRVRTDAKTKYYFGETAWSDVRRAIYDYLPYPAWYMIEGSGL